MKNAASEAAWRSLISAAQTSTGQRLDPVVADYLVSLLMRTALAGDLQDGRRLLGHLRLPGGRPRPSELRDIGDRCLLLAGLFLAEAIRRNVRLGQFVRLGKMAYHRASQAMPGGSRLFRLLCRDFTGMLDLLHVMQELGPDSPGLAPLDAFEVWDELGGPRALHRIRTFTTAFPVRLPPPDPLRPT